MEADGEIGIEGAVKEHEVIPEPICSDTYLDDQMRKAEPAWESVPHPEAWLDELRGGGGNPETSFNLPPMASSLNYS